MNYQAYRLYTPQNLTREQLKIDDQRKKKNRDLICRQIFIFNLSIMIFLSTPKTSSVKVLYSSSNLNSCKINQQNQFKDQYDNKTNIIATTKFEQKNLKIKPMTVNRNDRNHLLNLKSSEKYLKIRAGESSFSAKILEIVWFMIMVLNHSAENCADAFVPRAANPLQVNGRTVINVDKNDPFQAGLNNNYKYDSKKNIYTRLDDGTIISKKDLRYLDHPLDKTVLDKFKLPHYQTQWKLSQKGPLYNIDVHLTPSGNPRTARTIENGQKFMDATEELLKVSQEIVGTYRAGQSREEQVVHMYDPVSRFDNIFRKKDYSWKTVIPLTQEQEVDLLRNGNVGAYTKQNLE